MTFPSHAASCAAEPIDVVRIRLTRRASATVVVSEFRMANRVLAGWADEAAPASRDVQVDYEVVFFDGYRLHGRHDLLRRGRSHASLSRVVRRLFKAMAQGASMASAALAAPVPGLPLAEPSRYLVDG